MNKDLQTAIESNFDFFQRNLKEFLLAHRGKFALLRDKEVVGFFDGPGEAYRAGLESYPDEVFSIQEVEDRPAEMGLMSVALH